MNRQSQLCLIKGRRKIMPDSQELDDILNEIKNLHNSDKENEETAAVEPQETEEVMPDTQTETDSIADTDDGADDVPQETEQVGGADDTEEELTLEEEEFHAEEPENEETEDNADTADIMSAETDMTDIMNEEDADLADKKKSKKGGKNKGVIIAVIVVLVVAIAAAVAFAVINSGKEEETTAPVETTEATEAPVVVSSVNPLTGEDDYNDAAIGKRPIACVVENAAAARPQWGINDSDNPPDIILEGEVEGGETRMLWMYADYTSVPSQIGPMRSARPPYIKFSELFDAIFIHWGQSQTKRGTNYIGANTVFRVDEVDHINQMTYSGSAALFGRDGSRNVSTEHTGVLYGDQIEAAIEGEGFRTEADDAHYTKFAFTDDMKYDADCSSLGLTFSSRTATRSWKYDETDGMYHCSDYGTDVARENLLVLFDTTEYISKANYKNSGSAEIYCNYNLDGGSGTLACNGTSTEITWSVENGVIVLKDSAGADISLSVGTTWIGYASSNNGGAVQQSKPEQ